MDTNASVANVNLVVGINWRDYDKIISERIWYTRAIAELDVIKDAIRLVFFYTVHEINERNERLLVGCFAFPKYAGTAVRDPIEKKFIFSQDGNYGAMSADEDFAIKFPLSVKLPYLSSKTGERLWRVSDEEALGMLRSIYDIQLRSEDATTQDVLNIIELLVDELETATEVSIPVPPEIEAELTRIPDWLLEELNQCETAELPQNQSFIKSLLGRSGKNPLYNLQAAALQIGLGDYKFLLSLANYCFLQGYALQRESSYEEAARYFLEAANLYQRDPMITGSGWKQQKRSECVTKYIEAHVEFVLEANAHALSYQETETAISARIGVIRKYLPPAEIQRRIHVAYYASMGWFLYNSNHDAFLELISGIEGDIGDELPPELLAIYYDLLADQFAKKKGPCSNDFVQAANYKHQSLQIYKRLLDERQSDRARIGFLERSVDYYKLNALASSCDGDIDSFVKYIDTAIGFAEEINEEYPTEHRELNIHFLKGMKLGELTGHTEDIAEKAEFHLRASDEYSNITSFEGQKRYIFHQLLYYFYRLRHLIGTTDQDFGAAMLLSQEALEADWAKSIGSRYIQKYTLDVQKCLHLSIATFGSEASTQELEKLLYVAQTMEAREIKPSVRKIAQLVYGIQLIRLCGVNDERIIGETVRAIRSAICQLLESDTISADDIYDELQMEKEKLVEEETEQEILSKLRRRKLEEDFSVEAKEFLCDPTCARPKILTSIHQTVIAFLNSPHGGNIFVGVEDDTYTPVGVDTDLGRYGESRDKLKQAILSHIQDNLPQTLHRFMPGITISFPVVKGHTLAWIKVPPGTYELGLYVDNDGVAFIRKDGRLQRISDSVEKDEFAQQKREKRGIWSIRRDDV